MRRVGGLVLKNAARGTRCSTVRATMYSASSVSIQMNGNYRYNTENGTDLIQFRNYSSSTSAIHSKSSTTEATKHSNAGSNNSNSNSTLGRFGQKLYQYRLIRIPVDCYQLIAEQVRRAAHFTQATSQGKPVSRQDVRARRNLVGDILKAVVITGMFALPGSLIYGPAVIYLFPSLIPTALSSYFYSSSIGAKIAAKQNTARQDALRKLKSYANRFSQNKLNPGKDLAETVRSFSEARLAGQYQFESDPRLVDLMYKVYGVRGALFVPDSIRQSNLMRVVKRIREDDELIGSYENLKDADESEIQEALRKRNLTSREQLKTWLDLSNDKHHPVHPFGLSLIPAASSN